MRSSDAVPNPVLHSGPDDAMRWPVVAVIAAALIVAAHLGDAWAWSALRDPRVYERDWGRLLRILGFLPTWLLVAVALAVQDRGGNSGANPGWKWRGGLMVLVPAATGLLAEVLKLAFRRLRPGETSPEYVFRAFSDGPFSNKGMGLPSSHEMVAMGAAIVLARLFPRVAWMWYLLALGCGLTRVMAGAHYLSDVSVGAVSAWIAGALIVRWGLRKRTEAIAAVV
ncbi:MAG: phosphatase PAP2 family protein [Gemmatimonas sp.]